MTIALALYRAATEAAGLAAPLYLRRRAGRGLEFPARLAERRGIAGLPRPPGRLAWLHGASVGEVQSILPLLERLRTARPDLGLLVTTVTVTGARLLAQRLGSNGTDPAASGLLAEGSAVRHQFLPLDRAGWVGRFLDHWRPDLGVLVESELWPNLIRTVSARGVPLALVNARMSARSFRRWQRVPGLARDLLGRFRLCLAQGSGDAERLRALGAARAAAAGNLKFAAPPLPADAAVLARLHAALAGRPLWLMASTHPGEEAIAFAAHARLAAALPGLLTVVVPRHPERGAAVAAEAAAAGLPVARRSLGQEPGPGTAVFVGDTLGEMGLYYRLVPLAVMGGSFVPHGGQNPLEPARLDCALAFGPHMENFPGIAAAFLAGGGAAALPEEPAALADWLAGMLADPQRRRTMAEAAAQVAAREAGVLETVAAALLALLPPPAVEA